MKVPVCWLKDYVEFEDTIEGLADKLTFCGIEVEGIETIGANIPGVVVGQATAIEQHPNADKLRLVTVEYGAEAPIQIVCGAPNVTVGGKYPFAPEGTTLPGGFTLKKAKIRGVESRGMLCAKDELGLGGDHSGLWELDANLELGTPVQSLLGEPETVFELEITPNRPDCLSIIGVAREIATLYGTTLKRPEISIAECDADVNDLTSVEVQDADNCLRYTARVLKDVNVAESPDWMKKRLELAGLRPINNLVDITNFVLLEAGHPLHAFDKALLAEERIVIRNATDGEKLTTLDEEERELDAEMLMICDAEKPVAIGGVMGGGNSEIRDTTDTVLLEAASFFAPNIRATSKKLGLITDSSYRFQRGVDPEGVDWASQRACGLMCELAGAKVAKGLIDVYPQPRQPKVIECNWDSIRKLIGVEIPTEKMKSIFSALEFKVIEDDGENAKIQVPTYRLDMEREVDLTEEIARMFGVDNIPANIPHATLVEDFSNERVAAILTLRNALVGLGAYEIMNYTLVSSPLLDLFTPNNKPQREELPHPISMDQSVMRTALIPQLVESLGRNNSRQQREAVFFEIGRTFNRVPKREIPIEKDMVSIGMMGPVGRGPLAKGAPVTEQEMFVWMKGCIEKLLINQKINKVRFKQEDHPEFEKGRAITIAIGKRMIGRMGLVNAKIAKEYRFSGPVAAAELSLEALIANVFQVSKVKDVAVYPSMDRDFAFVVDSAVKHDQIIKAINQKAPNELENVALFDIYEGKNIGKGKKSLAYAFTYRADNRTLTDEEVNGWHEAIGKEVCEKLQAELRS
ncbi:phenylalanine--tRNA ligase subunit beta [Verrucomicrobiota bacterium]